MPYINQGIREDIDAGAAPNNEGELNYKISTIIRDFWQFHQDYRGIAAVLSALEGAKLEFYRRIAIPYEDSKIKQNGDVY